MILSFLVYTCTLKGLRRKNLFRLIGQCPALAQRTRIWVRETLQNSSHMWFYKKRNVFVKILLFKIIYTFIELYMHTWHIFHLHIYRWAIALLWGLFRVALSFTQSYCRLISKASPLWQILTLQLKGSVKTTVKLFPVWKSLEQAFAQKISQTVCTTPFQVWVFPSCNF